MLSAVKEIANSRPDEERVHLATYNYVKALNFIFEEGILSSQPVSSVSSPVLLNMKEGYSYFSEWKQKVSLTKPG